MVERCARAICRAERYDEDASWELYVPHVRAVIEALMDPTPDMMMATRDVEDNPAWDQLDLYAAEFKAALRTILSQPNEEGEGK